MPVGPSSSEAGSVRTPGIRYLLAAEDPSLPSMSQPPSRSEDVLHGVKYWKFSEISYMYKRDGNTYFEVVLKGRRFFWDPNKRNLIPYQKFDRSGLIRTNLTSIAPEKIILGGRTWLGWNTGFHRCQNTPFTHFLILRINGVNDGKFYLIAHYRLPVRMYRGGCDDTEPVDELEQSYGNATLAFVVMLRSGNPLIILADWGIVVELYHAPDITVSFGGDLYIVPEHLLTPALESTDGTLRARYEAVQRYLASAIKIPSSIPTK